MKYCGILQWYQKIHISSICFTILVYELLQDFASHVFKLHLLVGLPLSVLYQGLFLTTGFE